MPMKLSIKKKIIWPLLLLMIMPVLVLSIITNWNNYKFLNNYTLKQTNRELNNLLVLLDQVEKDGQDKEFILDYIRTNDSRNMFIIEDRKFIYSDIINKNIDEQTILAAISEDTEIYNKYVINYRVYNQWKWKIGILLDRDDLPEKLFTMNATIFFVITLFILFSLEAIVLITDNISKPITILLNGYNDIISGNFQKQIDIKREDELGLLGDAFNDMKNKIASRTNKFIQMKNFNDDILRSISTGIITTDVNGRVTKYNQAAIDMMEMEMEFEKDELVIIKVLLRQIMNTLKTKDSLNTVESFHLGEEGKNIYLDITTSLMKNSKGEKIGVICSFNDITARKRIEEKIDRIDKLASLGQVSAGLAHEIRNPLSGIKMSSQVLKRRLSEHLSESDERLFSANINEIDRLNGLITDLLDFAKPHLPRFEAVDAIDAVENSLRFSNKMIAEKNIKVDIKDDIKGLYACFDKGQLSQIFLNIIANAIKSMEYGGRLSISLSISTLNSREYMMVSFEDNGCGIAPENLQKIFDPFYTTYDTGTGLGLSVVHKLMTANKGEIDVQSRLGIGSDIRLYIPTYRSDSNEKESIDNRR